MRLDPNQKDEFRKSNQWGETDDMVIKIMERASEDDGEGTPFRSTPFSGGERNRIFMNQGDKFRDMTLLSGIDFREDGRGFVLFDYDQDGFQDMAIVSPNYPRLRIVRNQMSSALAESQENLYVELSLIGGHTSIEPSTEWSSRDPFGATVLVKIGDQKRVFVFSCGEGLASQNSKRIHIGMGKDEVIDELVVSWPSGKQTTQTNVKAGQHLTIFEDPSAGKASKTE